MPALEKHILLVEDNPAEEALFLHAFRKTRLPARLRVLAGAEEALAALSDGPLPALVAVDLDLSGDGGLRLIRQIRSIKRAENLPLLALAGPAARASRGVCCALGANDVLPKTADLKAYQVRLEQSIAYWTGLSSGPDIPPGHSAH